MFNLNYYTDIQTKQSEFERLALNWSETIII